MPLAGKLRQNPVCRQKGRLLVQSGGDPVAAPAVFLRLFYHACPNRIQHYIATKLQQIALTLYENRLVSSLENMPCSAISTVVPLGVYSIYVPHPLRQIFVYRLYQKVIVIIH